MVRLTAVAPLALLALLGAAPPSATVVTEVDGLRSANGVVSACLTQRPTAFPDCRSDPGARRVTLPAGEASAITFAGVAPGRYAVAVLHDENRNGRADKLLMLPREGFGFSRNPALRLGPPQFARAAFTVADQPVSLPIRMRYLVAVRGSNDRPR